MLDENITEYNQISDFREKIQMSKATSWSYF